MHPKDKRTGAGEATRAMVLGRLLFEKEQAPPSRFVRQFLRDLDALRAAAWEAGEDDDPTFKAARNAAHSVRIDLQHAPLQGSSSGGGPSDEYPHVALVRNESGPV